MAEQTGKRGRGCLFYVLVTGGVLVLIVLAGALAGLSMARRLIRDFTDTQQVVLPTARLSQEQTDRLHERISAFQQAIRQQKPAAPLALTADELNTLLATTPAAGGFSNKICLRIEGNALKGDLSLPLEALGLPVFKGRYLNGTATFGAELKNGQLRVNAETLSVKGKQLPKLYMDKIRSQNLAERVNADPQASGELQQLQEVRVQDGKLLLVPKNAER